MTRNCPWTCTAAPPTPKRAPWRAAACSGRLGATSVATDTDASIAGLAPGVYTATLEAEDSGNRLGTATAPLRLAALSIPLGGSPAHDGVCDDAAYDAGTQIQLKPYGDGSQASLRLVRDANYLWACFSGLKIGAQVPGAFVGLRFDVDNSNERAGAGRRLRLLRGRGWRPLHRGRQRRRRLRRAGAGRPAGADQRQRQRHLLERRTAHQPHDAGRLGSPGGHEGGPLLARLPGRRLRLALCGPVRSALQRTQHLGRAQPWAWRRRSTP